MKKFLFFIVAIFSVFSCSKESTENTAKVVFSISNIDSGYITKSSVDDLFQSTMPSGVFKLSIVSTTTPDRYFSVDTGSEVSLPYDSYTVKCSHYPNKADYCWHGNIYKSPSFEVSTTINVDNNTTSVSVPAFFTCWALVIDYSKVSKYRIQDRNGTFVDLTVMTASGDGNYGICYLGTSSVWTTDSPLKITVIPKDEDNYEPKTFTLVSNSNYDGTLVENGKWYSFNPSGVEKVNGQAGIEFPSWVCGN